MTQARLVPEVAARFDFAREVVAEAGALALDHWQRVTELEVHSKGVQDVVTEADVAVERLVKERFAAAYPQDAFFGEETGAEALEGARGVWVVDPIDGTQPFVSGMVNWCVSVAFVWDGVLQFGLVHNPPLDELYAGAIGVPATRSGKPISPHPGTALTDGITCLGYSPRIGPDDLLPIMERLLRRGGTFFRSGSGALALCYVADGRLLGFVEPHLNSYDALGALAVLEAAGVRTTPFLVGDALLKGNALAAGPAAVFDDLVTVLGTERPVVG